MSRRNRRSNSPVPKAKAPSKVAQGGAAARDLPSPEVFEDLPQDQQEAILQIVASSFTGPLPSPGFLAQYKEVDPEAVAWIFNAANEERQHRHWCEEEPIRQA